jgi:ribosome-binding protein aMBF1 (putative translation factor)
MGERPPLLVAFGQRVRSEREARGWTQTVLAERVEVRVTYLREIEHGRANPPSRRSSVSPARASG